MVNPSLVTSRELSTDAREKVRFLQTALPTPVGAYTGNSKGYIFVRKKVA